MKKMEKEKVSALSNVLMAFSTFIGVGGAVAYYMKEILQKSIEVIILIEVIYILIAIILLIIMGVKLK